MSAAGRSPEPGGPGGSVEPAVAVEVLLEALPYIERFRGSIVVVKFGGNAMSTPELFDSFAKDVVMMHRVGMRPVVVHGGGPQIGSWLERLGMSSEFVGGRRVTDADTLEVAQMVLLGQVNSQIVTALNTFGPVALGLSGTDALMLEARARDPELGYVGDVTRVTPALIDRTIAMDLVPVIATIGADDSGQIYNINADDAATEIARAIGAEKLIFLTDVPGLLRDVEDPASLIAEVSTAELESLVRTGVIGGGMVPKVEACISAVRSGVGSVHLIDGRIPHVLLLELLTHEGVGTMVSDVASEVPA